MSSPGVFVPSDPDDVITKPPHECPLPRKWTTLTKLENMAEDELPPKNAVLLCRIVHWKKPPLEKQKKLIYNKASGDGKSSQFDRTLVVMDVQSPEVRTLLLSFYVATSRRTSSIAVSRQGTALMGFCLGPISSSRNPIR